MEKNRILTHSITQSPSSFDALRTKALARAKRLHQKIKWAQNINVKWLTCQVYRSWVFLWLHHKWWTLHNPDERPRAGSSYAANDATVEITCSQHIQKFTPPRKVFFSTCLYAIFKCWKHRVFGLSSVLYIIQILKVFKSQVTEKSFW